jgi:hypothetical protein
MWEALAVLLVIIYVALLSACAYVWIWSIKKDRLNDDIILKAKEANDERKYVD